MIDRTTQGTEANSMDVPNICTGTGRKAFSFCGPDHWNGQNQNLNVIESLNTFLQPILKTICRDVNNPG